MRWLYIKNGNVAAQLLRVGANPEHPAEGGPDAFIGDFLSKDASPKLMISLDVVDDCVTDADVRAITYKVGGSKLSALAKVTLRCVACIKTAKQIITFKPDRIICGRVGILLWLTYILSLILRIPYIHSRHNSLEAQGDSIISRISLWLDGFCIRHSKGVICHGPFLADQVIDLGVDRDRVFDFDVGYKTFTDNLNPDDSQKPAIDDTIMLVYVGRMAANKGIYDLLDSTQMLCEEGIKIFVTYIGDGPEVQALADVATRKNMAQNLDIKGRVNHDLLPLYISRSHLMVTPTRSEFPEGRCMSAMEGLACGIPVLAPRNGPFPYLVEDGVNGLLYEVDNVKDMTDKIRSVVKDVRKYRELTQGAMLSKKKLERPDLTFYEAVVKAFRHESI